MVRAAFNIGAKKVASRKAGAGLAVPPRVAALCGVGATFLAGVNDFMRRRSNVRAADLSTERFAESDRPDRLTKGID